MVANQSSVNLNVTFKIRATEVDSTVAIPADSTIKIFRYGGIGGSTPIGTFSKLSFHKLSDSNKKSPLLVIDSIVNDHWNYVSTKKGYKARKFELVITDEDLK